VTFRPILVRASDSITRVQSTTDTKGQERELLTLPEVAERLRCSRSHLYVAVLPSLRTVHVGNRVLVRAADLEQYLEDVTVAPGANS
jgi:excisionase family DNA binding protein